MHWFRYTSFLRLLNAKRQCYKCEASPTCIFAEAVSCGEKEAGVEDTGGTHLRLTVTCPGWGVLHCQSGERSLRHDDIGHERLIECLRLFHPANYVITTFAGLLLICYRLLPLCVGKLSITCRSFDNKLYLRSKIQNKNCFMLLKQVSLKYSYDTVPKKVLDEECDGF